MVSTTKYIDVEVEVDLDDFTDEDILEEVAYRELNISNPKIEKLYRDWIALPPDKFQDELKDFFRSFLDVIIR